MRRENTEIIKIDTIFICAFGHSLTSFYTSLQVFISKTKERKFAISHFNNIYNVTNIQARQYPLINYGKMWNILDSHFWGACKVLRNILF